MIYDLMTISYDVKDCNIYIMARDSLGNRKVFRVKDFKPYYYEPDEKGEYVSCYGQRLRKVVCKSTVEVKKTRSEMAHEADVPFELRFLIDRDVYSNFRVENNKIVGTGDTEYIRFSPRVCYADIEVISPAEVMPSWRNPQWQILSIGAIDSYTKERKIWFLDDYPSEKDMLVDFLRYTHKFDLVVGWNWLNFDLPYIWYRMRVLRIPPAVLSPIGIVYEKQRGKIQVGGTEHLDFLKLFMTTVRGGGQLPTYDLKYVAKQFVDFTYVDYGDRIDELYRNGDIRVLKEYTINDVIALQLLDEKLGIIVFCDEIRRMTGTLWRLLDSNMFVIDTLLLREAKAKGVVLPSRRKEKKQPYQGAYVKEPPKGLHEGVAIFDIKSAYPSIIMKYQLSPDNTKLIPSLVKKLLQLKEKYSKEKKASDLGWRKYMTSKFLVNAVYGVMGNPAFRLFKQEIAAEITRRCRENIHKIEKHLEWSVLYSDTDSVFVKCRKEEVAEVLKRLKEISELPIDFDEYVKKVIWSAKKRYVYLTEDGKIVKKGVEVRRSDAAELTREVQEEFFRRLFFESPKSAIEYVLGVLRKFETYPLKKIGVPKGLSKPVEEYENYAHAEAVKISMQLFGLRFREDHKPLLIWVKQAKGQKVKYIALDIDHNEEEIRPYITVDWEKMKKLVIIDRLGKFLESLGVGWDGTKQTKLTAY